MREEFKVCTMQGILLITITTNHNFYHLGRHHDIEMIIEKFCLIMTIQFLIFILTTEDFMLIAGHSEYIATIFLSLMHL